VIDCSIFPRVEDHLEYKGTVLTPPRDGTKRASGDRVRPGQRVSRAARVYRRGISITAVHCAHVSRIACTCVPLQSFLQPSLVLSISLRCVRLKNAERCSSSFHLHDINSKFYYFQYSSIDFRRRGEVNGSINLQFHFYFDVT